jgi:hypothetical protein
MANLPGSVRTAARVLHQVAPGDKAKNVAQSAALILSEGDFCFGRHAVGHMNLPAMLSDEIGSLFVRWIRREKTDFAGVRRHLRPMRKQAKWDAPLFNR